MIKKTSILAVMLLLLGGTAHAAIEIAIFGDNSIDNFVNTSMAGFNATIVTDAQLSTAGFLNTFDTFLMTRDGTNFGTGLSVTAAANVASYVGASGNVSLLNGDFADGVSAAGGNFSSELVRNAIEFAAASGNGYVGEFNGTTSALTLNGDGFNPIGLIAGSAGPQFNSSAQFGTITLTANGVGHQVTSGLGFPVNPPGVEFGSIITGVDPTLVLAVYSNNNPAIIVKQGVNDGVIPEPTTFVVWSLLALVGTGMRRRKV